MNYKSAFTASFALFILCITRTIVSAQESPMFFPKFEASTLNPILKYGDGFADASWNDPSVLKVGAQYSMYVTAAIGITPSETNTVKVYRQISSDGYNWTLSPKTPVLEALAGSYYEGGTETPSVIFKDGVYHMYLTAMPASKLPSDFVIAHATSVDGITFQMDSKPILESDGSASIYGDLVGEPGAMIYRDSIFVFFTATGTVAGKSVSSIALMKSANGSKFDSPKIAVTNPVDVYPSDSNYWGLSTPSVLAIHDSIYLFTDVAQTINGNWTQVALHQFKTDGISGIWYHDSLPIHTKQDFNWTNGKYLSEIRSVTPLMDNNGLLRIWYAGNKLADVSGTDTTYNIFFDNLGGMHVKPDFWGIGTSEYQFPLLTNLKEETATSAFQLLVYPNPAKDLVFIQATKDLKNASIKITDARGQTLNLTKNFSNGLCQLDVSELGNGIYFVRIEVGQEVWFEKISLNK